MIVSSQLQVGVVQVLPGKWDGVQVVGSQLYCSERLRQGLKSLEGFCSESTIIEEAYEYCQSRFAQSHLESKELNSTQCFKTIEDLQTLGWDWVHEVDDDFGRVVLQRTDDKNRRHFMTIDTVSNTCSSDWTPLPFTSRKTLVETAKGFEEHLAQILPLFDELDTIDCNFVILDPVLPAPRSILRRRLACFDGDSKPIKNVFLEIILHAQSPRSPIAYEVFGDSKRCAIWRQQLQEYAWDSDLDVASNLNLAVRSVGMLRPIQNPTITEKANRESHPEQSELECGICYVYRLDSEDGVTTAELPDDPCKKCGRPFHHSCALGWLRALPTTKRSFRILVGDCPTHPVLWRTHNR